MVMWVWYLSPRDQTWLTSTWQTRRVITATSNEGRVVAIKHVVNELYPDELAVSVKMCVQKIREKGNPCVPIAHHFSLVWERTARPPSDFIVMPLLSRFDDPPFYNVNEVIDFVHQALEVRNLSSWPRHALTNTERRGLNTCRQITSLICT
jgi:hypothetical protein